MARANWSLRSSEGAAGTGLPGNFRRWGSMMKYAADTADMISSHYLISGLSRVLAEGNDQWQNFRQPPLQEVSGQFIQRGSRRDGVCQRDPLVVARVGIVGLINENELLVGGGDNDLLPILAAHHDDGREFKEHPDGPAWIAEISSRDAVFVVDLKDPGFLVAEPRESGVSDGGQLPVECDAVADQLAVETDHLKVVLRASDGRFEAGFPHLAGWDWP